MSRSEILVEWLTGLMVLQALLEELQLSSG
jgi:hypothetical protein